MRFLTVLLVSFFVLSVGYSYAHQPSAFEIGQQIGTNFNNVKREARDENAIESILSGVRGSKNPEDFQNAMYEVLIRVSPERQGNVLAHLQHRHDQLMMDVRSVDE